MKRRTIKSIITLGPSVNTQHYLKIIKDKGVDFVRVNLSHSSIEDLDYFLRISKELGVPFILDTEGSQIRTGDFEKDQTYFKDYHQIKIFTDQIVGNNKGFCLKPDFVVKSLHEGDVLHIDFDTLTLQIIDTSTIDLGYVIAKVITGGYLGQNKAVVIDPRFERHIDIPALTEKDLRAIEIGLKMQVQHIAVSFVRSSKTIETVRKATSNKMKIISKIECLEALQNLDEIIEVSDFLLIDRGDLSKEIPIAKIPFTQKLIIEKAKKCDKAVFVATNLLESMVDKPKPTRAEVHDVITSILDGAEGLILAAETAIGKYPIKCINTLHDLINHVEGSIDVKEVKKDNFKYKDKLETSGYLLGEGESSLIAPHGGKIINRFLEKAPPMEYFKSLPKIKVDFTKQMEIEQIATGVFSPLEGFMNEDDFNSVLDKMKLSNGLIWPLPIVLDVTTQEADKLTIGGSIALINAQEESFAVLHLDSKYIFDKEKTAKKIYGTLSDEHPGVRMVKNMKPVLLSGKVDLISQRKSATMAYELTPQQVRKLFKEKGWIKIAGFHTRNIPHRGHEFIQVKVLEDECCDGFLIHPVVGMKKKGDFSSLYLIKSYERLIKNNYLSNKAVLAAFPTHSRYAGPREAVFTALCRKNYGCSHFIVGRDHTGVGKFYHHQASQKIFDDLYDLGITIIKVDEVIYSNNLKKYFFKKDCPEKEIESISSISGSLIRSKLLSGEKPPHWLMRPEISEYILEAIKNKEQVFVGA